MPRGKNKGKFPTELTPQAAPAANLTSERKITPEDQLIAQISIKDTENASLRFQLLTAQLEQQKRVMEESQKNLRSLNEALNKKYSLDPATDVINVMTGQISKRS